MIAKVPLVGESKVLALIFLISVQLESLVIEPDLQDSDPLQTVAAARLQVSETQDIRWTAFGTFCEVAAGFIAHFLSSSCAFILFLILVGRGKIAFIP